MIANSMTFVVANNTFRTNIGHVVFTEIFGLLLGVFQTELLHEALFLVVSSDSIGINDGGSIGRNLTMHAWTDSTELVDIFLVVDVVWSETENLPRMVKFFIRFFTSGEKNLRQVGQVRMLDVLKSIRQIWQNV
jgi:hypothetical protein